MKTSAYRSLFYYLMMKDVLTSTPLPKYEVIGIDAGALGWHEGKEDVIKSFTNCISWW